MNTMDADVLVVGAGPTGLMLANQLGRRGVRTWILDRHAGPARRRQPSVFRPNARDLRASGHRRARLELGKRANGGAIARRGRLAARVPLGDIGHDLSPYPYLLILGQDDNERILGEALRGRGMSVEWNTELVGLKKEADRVIARIKQPDGSIREVAAAAWVAGCDGARSTVRELSGVAFEGAPYEHVFYVADTQVTGPMVPDEINVYLFPGASTFSFRCAGPITGGWSGSCRRPCAAETI